MILISSFLIRFKLHYSLTKERLSYRDRYFIWKLDASGLACQNSSFVSHTSLGGILQQCQKTQGLDKFSRSEAVGNRVVNNSGPCK